MNRRLGVGAALATIGAAGVVLSILLNWTGLPRPWSYLIGFACGLSAGLGAVLALHGLWMRRKGR